MDIEMLGEINAKDGSTICLRQTIVDGKTVCYTIVVAARGQEENRIIFTGSEALFMAKDLYEKLADEIDVKKQHE